MYTICILLVNVVVISGWVLVGSEVSEEYRAIEHSHSAHVKYDIQNNYLSCPDEKVSDKLGKDSHF